MIVIDNKGNCCGCSACVQICPKQCISFVPDPKGFGYPEVDETQCINCGLCEKVCPFLNRNEETEPIKVYAATNPNTEVRKYSSSGGVFTMLAQAIIREGGVVFGARFDENWNVIHDFVETEEELRFFRGSKYVQSKIGDSYKKTQSFLDEGRIVLFSGTACQISGLTHFLRKEYNNLLTIDVVCHGVPSPTVWKSYLEGITDNVSSISEISFRDKTDNWRNNGFRIVGQNVNITEAPSDNIYFKSFIRNLSLRESCFYCPVKNGRCLSDITLGDFWGYKSENTDFKESLGVSLVMVYTENGFRILDRLDLNKVESNYRDAIKCNPSIVHPVGENSYYKPFWSVFLRRGLGKTSFLVSPSLLIRAIFKFYEIFGLKK